MLILVIIALFVILFVFIYTLNKTPERVTPGPIPPIPPGPVSENGSMYFDNTISPNGSHVSYDNDTDLAIGDKSFTIEYYHYWTGGNFPRVFSIGEYSERGADIAVSYEDDTFFFWKDGLANPVGSVPPKNTWVHIAIVGTSGEGIKIYQNGIEIGEVTSPYDFTDNTTPLMIGNESVPSSIASFVGNITNFRWVVGTAIYTENFPVPSILLPNVSGTQLLLNVLNTSNVVADTSNAARTHINTDVVFSPLLPPVPFVVLPTPPSAPEIDNIIAGDRTLTVNFSPPNSDGGEPITNYQYTTYIDEEDEKIYLTLGSPQTSSPIIITVL